jgi:hypothetical protein
VKREHFYPRETYSISPMRPCSHVALLLTCKSRCAKLVRCPRLAGRKRDSELLYITTIETFGKRQIQIQGRLRYNVACPVASAKLVLYLKIQHSEIAQVAEFVRNRSLEAVILSAKKKTIMQVKDDEMRK